MLLISYPLSAKKENSFIERKLCALSKDIQNYGRISKIGGSGKFINGKDRNTANEDMVFVVLIEIILLFICLIGSSMSTKFIILISFGLFIRRNFPEKKV